MLKNNRPYTNENGWIDDNLLSDLAEDRQAVVLAWIRNNLRPRKTPNLYHTSYGLKHVLERDTGIYVTNNQFKDAMLICGYHPRDANKLNWQYCISEKSPCFKRDRSPV